MPSSPEEMARSMIANLKTKTGKTLPQWLKVIERSKLSKHGEIVKHLKTEHGMTHGFANLVAHQAKGSAASAQSGDSLVDGQYAGAKRDLRPIYDALIRAVSGFGKDVEVSPKKSYVSLRRNKQFGIIQPSTRTRVDVGINVKGAAPTKRLEASGSFNAMVSHRVRVADKREVDAELVGWLKRAYDAS